MRNESQGADPLVRSTDSQCHDGVICHSCAAALVEQTRQPSANPTLTAQEVLTSEVRSLAECSLGVPVVLSDDTKRLAPWCAC
jgi:ferredoxin